MVVQRQRVTVMRHSTRADKVGEWWEWQNLRPWDTPLSRSGVWLAAEQAIKAVRANPEATRIYSSPFTRCTQTAASLMCAYDMGWSNLTIDRGLSELYSLFGTQIPTWGGPMSAWFNILGKATVTNFQLLRKFVYPICSRLHGTLSEEQVQINGQFPSHLEAYVPLVYYTCKRFADKFHELVNSELNENIVIVTHMAGVLSIINTMSKKYTLFTPPGSFFVLERQRIQGISWGSWEIVHFDAAS